MRVGSPAARAMSRRGERAATPKRLQEGAKETGSDEDWETDDDEGEEEAAASESERCDGVVRGRVRRHAATQPSPDVGVHDERRKCLADRMFVRSVIKRGVGPSGAAEFEAVPAREEYESGDEGSAKSQVGAGHARVRRRQLQRWRHRGAVDGQPRLQGRAVWRVLGAGKPVGRLSQ